MNPQVTADLVSFFSSLITEERLALFQQVIANRTRYIATLLGGIDNPQDVSAVMRSCECFGIQDVHLAGSRPFAATKGIAVGAVKWLTVVDHADAAKHDSGSGMATTRAARHLQAQGFSLIGVHDDRDLPSLASLSIGKPLAICFTRSQAARDALHPFMTRNVRMPTVGFGAGFNLSIQAALCFAWLRRQMEKQAINSALETSQKQALLLDWLLSMRQKRLGRVLTRFMDDYGYDAHALSQLSGPASLRSRVQRALACSDNL